MSAITPEANCGIVGKPMLSGGFPGLSDSVLFILNDFKDGIQAGDFEEPGEALARAQYGHVTFLITNGGPDRNELAQAGAVHVFDAGEVQDEVLLPFRQETIHEVAQRQIEDPQSAGEIEDHHIACATLDNLERHSQNIILSPSRNLAVLGVDPDNLAVLHKERNAHLEPGFEFCDFRCATGGGVAAEPGFGGRDRKLDVLR